MKTNNDDMDAEYDFSNGVRGKHHKAMEEGYTVTVYSPNADSYSNNVAEKANYLKIDNDVSEYFENSEQVNNALRTLINIIPKHRKRKLQNA